MISIGIIQLWRRVTDSILIDECTDDIVIDNTTVKGTSGICFERARSRKCISIILIINLTTVGQREKGKTYVTRQNDHCCYQLISHFLFIFLVDMGDDRASTIDEEILRGSFFLFIHDWKLCQTPTFTHSFLHT
jgi:hypothetical protein